MAALTMAGPQASAAESELAQTYELRGFFGTPENLEVSLRKPGTDKSQWVRVGEKTDGMLVEKADAKAGTAMLRVGGATYQLRLQGVSSAVAAKPIVAPAEEAKPAPPAKMDAARREELSKKFETLFGSLTPAQNDAMNTAMREKFAALEKAHPEWKDNATLNNNPEELEKAVVAITPVFREGLEAASKVPGKDGKELVVPDDLEDMIRATAQTEAEKAKAKAQK